MRVLLTLFFSCIAVFQLSYATVKINTAMGEVIVNSPSRVVTLEHRYTEMVLSLGVIPVGVADINSYQDYYGIDGKKLNSVENVGRRAAPNLESIAGLKPTLIIGAKLRNAPVYPVLSSIAPTLLFNYIQMPNAHSQPLAGMFTEFKAVAKALGKETEAKQVMTSYQHTTEKAKAQISQLKKQGKLVSNKVAIAQFLPGSPKLRLLTTDSVVIEVLHSIGLQPAWPVKGGPSTFGYRTVGIQTLSVLGSANVFYFNERADDHYLESTLKNPIWKNLTFVKEGLTYRLSQQTWPWGGPLALEKFIDEVVRDLQQKSGRHVAAST